MLTLVLQIRKPRPRECKSPAHHATDGHETAKQSVSRFPGFPGQCVAFWLGCGRGTAEHGGDWDAGEDSWGVSRPKGACGEEDPRAPRVASSSWVALPTPLHPPPSPMEWIPARLPPLYLTGPLHDMLDGTALDAPLLPSHTAVFSLRSVRYTRSGSGTFSCTYMCVVTYTHVPRLTDAKTPAHINTLKPLLPTPPSSHPSHHQH